MAEYKIHHSTYDLDSLLPEQKARVKIDQMLKDSGWTVVSRDDFREIVNCCGLKNQSFFIRQHSSVHHQQKLYFWLQAQAV